MKAFVVDKYKKKGALRLASVPEPEVQHEDVLVRVHAMAVNLLDSKVRDGEFKLFLPYRPPFVLGHDVAALDGGGGAGDARERVVDGTIQGHAIGAAQAVLHVPDVLRDRRQTFRRQTHHQPAVTERKPDARWQPRDTGQSQRETDGRDDRLQPG